MPALRGAPCTKTHKTEINISAGVASKRPWFYLPFVGSRGQSPEIPVALALRFADVNADAQHVRFGVKRTSLI